MKTYDFLIVGAGFTGSVLAERIATELDKNVLIIEKRDHIGGNAYDFVNDAGILVHKYGPHTFHTNSKKIWDYLSLFTQWRHFYLKPLAMIGDQAVPIPFNLNSLQTCFEPGFAKKMEETLIKKYGYGRKIPILKMRESADEEISFLADFIYKNVFLGYTKKQWGFSPQDIDPSVTARVPVHISRDNRYFQDSYQGVPLDGYTKMFERMLAHKNIEIQLDVDFFDIQNEVSFDQLIYTGPIDTFFDYLHGELSYRSLRFEFQNIENEFYQQTAVVTYPNDYDYTRITEFKHLTGQSHPMSTIAFEYPRPHIPGKSDPYYPIPHSKNREILEKYKRECKKLKGNVFFAGRLADYQYYNMDQAVARALSLFEKEICLNLSTAG